MGVLTAKCTTTNKLYRLLSTELSLQKAYFSLSFKEHRCWTEMKDLRA